MKTNPDRREMTIKDHHKAARMLRVVQQQIRDLMRHVERRRFIKAPLLDSILKLHRLSWKVGSEMELALFSEHPREADGHVYSPGRMDCESRPGVFGQWTHNAQLNVLTHRNCPGYVIDLDQMTTSAQALDWIFQVTAKAWVSREDAGYLIEAIRALVNPQAKLCSWGVDQTARRSNSCA